MKSLNYFELKSLLAWLEPQLVGSQLQEIWTNGELLVFELYLQRSLFLIVDLRMTAPALWLSDKKPPVPKKSKPVSLFLNSHAKNLRVTELFADPQKGRIVDLWFEGPQKTCHCELTLIPRVANLMVESGDKKIYWEKPRPMVAAQLPAPADVQIQWADWCLEKSQEIFSSKKQQGKETPDTNKALEKVLEKKRKAVLALQESLSSSEHERWQALGQHLKTNEPIPAELSDIYNKKISLKENREKAFQKAKDLVRKQQGTRKRLQELEAEIAKLMNEGLPAAKTSASNKMLQKTDSKARKLVLDEGVEALIGKSAADNLAILRQARAWDLWMHLKDYPGAHAIVFRQKNKNVTPRQIQQVAEWVISESRKISVGAKYDVVVVECRHVRPIKGDKLGRVTYHHPQTYTFGS